MRPRTLIIASKGGSFDIIMYECDAAGRLYVCRGDEEIEILDITVLPEYRNLGIATSLVREITNEAAAANCPVIIYVESFNPSQKLFGELGFTPAGGDEMVRRFQWTVPADS